MTQRIVGPWQFCATRPNEFDSPSALARSSVNWMDCPVPTTVAAALRANGAWALSGAPRRFDAEDWWWRAHLPHGANRFIYLDGLATVAQIYIDGVHALTSESMFLSHQLPISDDAAEVAICFRSLDALLSKRRPRPRWRAPMIENQQLRWFRTTLLGRTPGWSPQAAPVGPWRNIYVGPARSEYSLRVRIEGTTGIVEIAGQETRIPNAERWWPHTHGIPVLHTVRTYVGDEEIQVRVGFREIELNREGNGFEVRVNGVPVFCRGACWTPLDVVSLGGTREEIAAALRRVRDAGMNMVRISGTMVYESHDFRELADELGLLVWQDFMFANMDYPHDPQFTLLAEEEARQELVRWQGHPSLAILCGNSEGEQQAAMWGAPRDVWFQNLFHDTLPRIAREMRPDVPYWPSSAHGGAFPHFPAMGTTSYYGVGAYLRPLEDARRCELRFATECLAFANIPSPAALDQIAPSLRAHHPSWKARTPRDLGAGWDFDDVRDHYVQQLFHVDALTLRYSDHERYLSLGRVATGEVMAASFGEWRRGRSPCRGALIWFLRDLWMGGGWGICDAAGQPKSAYYYCRRVMAAIAMHLSDEGLNGLAVHVVNDLPNPFSSELEVSLWKDGEIRVGSMQRTIEVAPHSNVEIPAADLFDDVPDLTYAYRFGPPVCDLVIARAGPYEAFYFPLGLPSGRELDLGISGEVRPRKDRDADLFVRTRRFAQSVALEFEGFDPDDNFFHLAPRGSRTIRLKRVGAAEIPNGTIQPLNAVSPFNV